MPIARWFNTNTDPEEFFNSDHRFILKKHYNGPVFSIPEGKRGFYTRSGSVEICNPAPNNTDIDYFFVGVGIEDFSDIVSPFGFTRTNELYGGSTIATYRSGIYNFILTYSLSAFNDILLATNIAKVMNLLDKQQRIDLFGAIAGYHEFYDVAHRSNEVTSNTLVSDALRDIGATAFSSGRRGEDANRIMAYVDEAFPIRQNENVLTSAPF